MLHEYHSFQTCGVDIKQFYKEMGTSIFEVHNNTGAGRQALSGLPVGHAAPSTVKKRFCIWKKEHAGL